MATYITAGVAGALALLFILSTFLKWKPSIRTLLKFIAGVGFTSVGICAYLEGAAPTLAFVLVVAGLIFGMVGDFLLAMREVRPEKIELFTMCGIGAFLAGHIFYIILFGTQYRIGWAEPVLAVVGAALLMIACRFLFKLDFGKLFIPACVYCVVILFMLCCAVFYAAASITTASILLLIGGTLFVISDFILAFIYFSPKKVAVLGLFNLLSYFAAQILIAVSLMFIV